MGKKLLFFPHLVLVFSSMKWFWSLCVHPSSNIVSIPNQCFSDVTCFKCFLHSLHIKYIQSFKNMQCFCCVTCFKCFSNPLELKHTQEFMTIQCFSAVTCFKCFFFYSMVNTSNSLSPSTVSVLLHSARLFFHILWFIKCLVLWYVSTVSVHTSSYTLIDLSASCVLGLSHG